MMGLLAMTAMMGAFGMGGGGHSSAAERHDPDREKTPEDLERMAAAQRKRDRKAARRNSLHNAEQSRDDGNQTPALGGDAARRRDL